MKPRDTYDMSCDELDMSCDELDDDVENEPFNVTHVEEMFNNTNVSINGLDERYWGNHSEC